MGSDAVESKKKPYRPGEASRNYFKLPPVKREAIREEVNRRFRAETGVTRGIDPTSKADLELRRIWLRMRDEAMEVVEYEEFIEFKADMLLPDGISDEMRSNGWEEAAELMETWFSRPPAFAPKGYSAPVTDIIKMDWVLKFPVAKSVYDDIFKDRVWSNVPSQKRMAEVLKSKPRLSFGQTVPFGDLSLGVATVDQEWINARPVEGQLIPDGLQAALHAFVFNIAVAGKVTTAAATPQEYIQMAGKASLKLQVTIEEVGVYVKDSFDFNGNQFLGWWGPADVPINNSDFQRWRAENHTGGDFLVYSDVKRTRVNPTDTVTVWV
jgi:hypothetical protein